MNKFYIILIIGFLLIGLGIFLKYKSKQQSKKVVSENRFAYLEAKEYTTDYFISEIGLILVGIGFWGIFFKN